MSSSPKNSQKQSRDQENASGVVRKGRFHYVIDGEEIKGIKVLWLKNRKRIEAMELQNGFIFTKKGNRVPLAMLNKKRQATEAELPEKVDVEDDSSSSDSSKEDEPPVEETKESKKKAAPKKNAKKRQKTSK